MPKPLKCASGPSLARASPDVSLSLNLVLRSTFAEFIPSEVEGLRVNSATKDENRRGAKSRFLFGIGTSVFSKACQSWLLQYVLPNYSNNTLNPG